jgi:hypothetical protein
MSSSWNSQAAATVICPSSSVPYYQIGRAFDAQGSLYIKFIFCVFLYA